MPYFSATGTSDTVVPFINKDNWQKNAFFAAWQIYQIMNGMSVTERPDFSKVHYFWYYSLRIVKQFGRIKGISMETGVLSKGRGTCSFRWLRSRIMDIGILNLQQK